MKKGFVVLLTIILVLALAFTGCASQKPAEPAAGDTSWDDIKAKGYMTVGLDDSFPPMGFRDEKGDIVGFDIDLAKRAAELMGIEVKFQPVVWSGIIMELNNKNIDLVWNGMTITAERQEAINFSKPYLANRQIIVVQKDADITTKADLAGKKIAVQAGSSAVDAVKSDEATYNSLEGMVEFPDNTAALLDLAAGRVSAVVVDEIVGRYYIAKKPDLYKVLEENFGDEQFGIGIRKSDEAFRAELQKAIDTMITDGSAKEISEKWFGADIVLK
ncbi:MAG: amino acid ABC transporter substrate-binding protein [Gracilibacter sp. BRH_c7a]|nr:MAG: amino acid ABC transporter substrate-binding protein [Gracilibacter sp. BRH_c7a]